MRREVERLHDQKPSRSHARTPVTGARWQGGLWEAQAGAHVVRARTLVLATNAFTPRLVPSLAPRRRQRISKRLTSRASTVEPRSFATWLGCRTWNGTTPRELWALNRLSTQCRCRPRNLPRRRRRVRRLPSTSTVAHSGPSATTTTASRSGRSCTSASDPARRSIRISGDGTTSTPKSTARSTNSSATSISAPRPGRMGRSRASDEQKRQAPARKRRGLIPRHRNATKESQVYVDADSDFKCNAACPDALRADFQHLGPQHRPLRQVRFYVENVGQLILQMNAAYQRRPNDTV